MQPLSKRTIASRANGAKSQGPKTIAGKRRSSANSLRHGLLAKSIVLNNESENVFGQLFDEHLQKLNPADGVEYAVVEEIVTAAWRLRRIWDIEATLFNQAIDRSTADTEAGRTADAFSALAATNQLQLLDRYESRLHRMYQRSLDTLQRLREVPEVQPHPEPDEPIPEAVPDLPPNEPKPDLTPSPDNNLSTPIENEASPELVAQAVPPAALKPDTSASPKNESRISYDFEPFHLIKFPSKT
jgi:hypothetical protein